MTPDEARRILEERAVRLAAVPDGETMGKQRVLLCFTLESAQYAVEAVHVLEVYPLPETVAVPGTPPHVIGLINRRGRLLTVIDLRPMLDLPITVTADKAGQAAQKAQIMVAAVGQNETVAVRIDSLRGVFSVQESALFMASELLQNLPSDVATGVATIDGQMTVLLNLSQLLMGSRWLVNNTVR